MTSRERLLTVLSGGIPDHVPVAPDTSNMIPCRLTGLPFWDIYLYNKIPLWKAYINCVKHFGFDSLMDNYVSIDFEELGEIDHDLKTVIVLKNDDMIVTQGYREAGGKKFWEPTVAVYYRDNPPTGHVKPEFLGLGAEPVNFKPLEGVVQWPTGEALLKTVKDEMGDSGLVGVGCGQSCFISNQDDIYDFYDYPEKYYDKRDELLEYYKKRFDKLMSLEHKPDFLTTGWSGTLVYQTVDTFRELGLPIVQQTTKLAKAAGIPTHLHSCGPEAQLVKICAQETDLTVIDPLEIAPMGNCDLAELKMLYGDKLVLKGNLHTTEVMLKGSVQDVINASKKAIDDAAKGGRFILSTGDQCGRDTPDENIFAMIETAKTYGKY